MLDVGLLHVYDTVLNKPPFEPNFREGDDVFLTSPLMVTALKKWCPVLPCLTLWCIGLTTKKAAEKDFPKNQIKTGRFESVIKNFLKKS